MCIFLSFYSGDDKWWNIGTKHMKLETGWFINKRLAVYATTGWNKRVIKILVMWQAHVMNVIQSIQVHMELLDFPNHNTRT